MPASHYQSNGVPDVAQDPFMVEEINRLTFGEAHTDELELRSDRAWNKIDSALLTDHNLQAGEVDIGLRNVDVPDLMFDEATPSTSSRGFSPVTPRTPLELVGALGLSPASDMSSPTDGCKSTSDDHYNDPSPYGLQAEHSSATSSGVYDARFIPERFTPATILARANAISHRRLQPPSPRFAPGPKDAFAQSLCTRPPPARAQFPSDRPSSLLRQRPSSTSRGHTPYTGTRPTQLTTPHIPHQHALPAPGSAGAIPLGYQGNPYATVPPQLPTNLAASWGDRQPYAQDQRRQTLPYYLPPHDVTAQASLPGYHDQVPPNGQVRLGHYVTEGYARPPFPVPQAASSNEQPLPHAIGRVAGGTFALPAHGFAPAPAAAEQLKVLAGPHKGSSAPRKRATSATNGLADRSLVAKGGAPKANRVHGVKALVKCQIANCTTRKKWSKNALGNHIRDAHGGCHGGSPLTWKCEWVVGCTEGYKHPWDLGKHILNEHQGKKYACVCGVKPYTQSWSLKRHIKARLKVGENWHRAVVEEEDGDEEEEQEEEEQEKEAGPSI